MWAAALTGALGGIVYVCCNKLLYQLKIDDPIDAVPIHFGCGIFGGNAISWFHKTKGILYCGGARLFGV